jgi:hypothetical protein
LLALKLPLGGGVGLTMLEALPQPARTASADSAIGSAIDRMMRLRSDIGGPPERVIHADLSLLVSD